ncbi:hypothetical protein [Aquicoccus porphyridii]|uniref:hypothetical protein n=1 Tax=Aquicoccus porphyridii TaxID=1852029 RepID=UPI00273DF6ED|nr:hypothetical protein [Aquicoccus porphyridii]
MDERGDISVRDRVLSWLPYALPVLGGFLGMLWVQMNPAAQLNPVVAVVLGVVAGRLLSVLVLRLVPGR